jgi:hypothetical protein
VLYQIFVSEIVTRQGNAAIPCCNKGSVRSEVDGAEVKWGGGLARLDSPQCGAARLVCEVS